MHEYPNREDRYDAIIDTRCFRCGRWGWEGQEVGEVVSLAEKVKAPGPIGGIVIPETAPRVNCCDDCVDEIFEALGWSLTEIDGTPIVLEPSRFESFVCNGCENDGSLKFETETELVAAGFLKDAIYGNYRHGFNGVWRLNESDNERPQLEFCCTEDAFPDYIQRQAEQNAGSEI